MILEALRSMQTDSDTPSYYKPQIVSWVIHLTEEGEFVSISDTRDKKNVLRLLLPTNGRASDVSPRIAADNATYVLPFGCYKSTKKAEKMFVRHNSFKKITKECAESFELMRAVVRFLNSDIEAVIKPYAKEIKENENIAFMVDGEYLTTQPEIASYWKERCAEAAVRPHQMQSGEVAVQCLICGTPIDSIIDAYVFQGTTGSNQVSMIPWNDGMDFTFSYGMNRGENSPICTSCSDVITRNYNSLHHHHSIKVGSVEYLVVSKSAKDVQFSFELLARPKEEDVHALYQINQAYLDSGSSLEYDEHYWLLFTTAPSPGRGFFFGKEYSLNQTRDRVTGWLKAQEIAGNDHDTEYYSIGQVLAHLYAPKKNKHSQDVIPVPVLDRTFTAVLEGRMLPRQLMVLAIQRNRTEMRVTKQRAILLNLMLNQIEGVNRMSLDQQETNKGYLLGRVLSLVTQAQREAIGKVNAPLAARFWSGFSTAPGVSFPRLMSMYNQYHNKLQKTRPAVAVAIGKQLTEVLSMVGGTCPNRLSLEEQGAFALGFYYQEQLRYQKKDVPDNAVAESKSEQVGLGLEEDKQNVGLGI